jgi:hypothetical protein
MSTYRCHRMRTDTLSKESAAAIEQILKAAYNRFATADTINHRYTQRCQMIEEHGRLTSEQETP